MKLLHFSERLAYVIQYTIPVNNPEDNVFVRCSKGVHVFELPINHPFAHNISLRDLIDSVNSRELLALSTGLNNTSGNTSESTLVKDCASQTECSQAKSVNSGPQSGQVGIHGGIWSNPIVPRRRGSVPRRGNG